MLFTAYTSLTILAGMALFGLATVVSAAAVTAAPTNQLATLLLYNTSDCTDAPTVLNLYPDVCSPMSGVAALKVVYHDKGLSYNSLRTYDVDGCGGGWSLQPLDEGCFQYVKLDQSIQVVTGKN